MFCYFAPVTRHSFQAMCTVFSRKDLFDGLLRISTRKANAEPRCLTSLGGHDGAICAAKHLELVHVHHLANPYTDLTNSLRGTKYFLRETNTVFRDTNNSLRGTKYFLREIACVQPPPPLGKNRGERRLCFTVDNRVQRPRDFFTDLWKMI